MKQSKKAKRESALERRKVNLGYWKNQVKNPDPKNCLDTDQILRKIRICEQDIKHLEEKK